MLFAASWSLSSHLYGLFQYAPSNIIIRGVHTRSGIKWGPLVGLVGVAAYATIMAVAVAELHHSAPGWINLIVLIAFWDTIKSAFLIPTSTVRLLRVRHQEQAITRDYLRAAKATAPNV